MAKTEQQAKTSRESDRYTIERALSDAANLLKDQFGDTDQKAAVSLATFLYQVHEREEFERRHDRNEGQSYGSPEAV